MIAWPKGSLQSVLARRKKRGQSYIYFRASAPEYRYSTASELGYLRYLSSGGLARLDVEDLLATDWQRANEK